MSFEDRHARARAFRLRVRSVYKTLTEVLPILIPPFFVTTRIVAPPPFKSVAILLLFIAPYLPFSGKTKLSIVLFTPPLTVPVSSRAE